jgi:hypothetical protein
VLCVCADQRRPFQTPSGRHQRTMAHGGPGDNPFGYRVFLFHVDVSKAGHILLLRMTMLWRQVINNLISAYVVLGISVSCRRSRRRAARRSSIGWRRPTWKGRWREPVPPSCRASWPSTTSTALPTAHPRRTTRCVVGRGQLPVIRPAEPLLHAGSYSQGHIVWAMCGALCLL